VTPKRRTRAKRGGTSLSVTPIALRDLTLTGPTITLNETLRRLIHDGNLAFGDLPAGRISVGQVAGRVDVPGEHVQELMRAALARRGGAATVWTHGEMEIVAHLGEARVAVREGVVLVEIALEADDVSRTGVTVAFGVGTAGRPAGMLATTERRPRGPLPLVEAWGEAVTASAWRALVETAASGAAEAGVDEDGVPLVPGALEARDDMLTVVAQARHAYTRSQR
jgi:hypothetical protein